MTIDWFTLGAQVLNFLVLVYLLRRFLFPPIIRAIDGREKLIASRLADAEQKAHHAVEAREEYERREQELSASVDEITAKARKDSEKVRAELLEQARADVDADETRWRDAIRSQKEEFLSLLRVRTVEQVFATVRRTLLDLADEQLEQRIVAKFIQRMQGAEKAETAAIKKNLEKDGVRIHVASAFKLPEDARNSIRGALKEMLGREVKPVFDTGEDLIGGIELRSGEVRISWSLRGYLDEVEREVSEAIDEAG